MSRGKLWLALLLALPLTGAIKPYYGGELAVRLNEPASFHLNTASYSNLIFYSLIYENFFYMKRDGEIASNIFTDYRYDPATRTLYLTLKENLSFSNGKPLTVKNIQVSLKVFLGADLLAASKLNKAVKSVRADQNQVAVELLADNPDILSLLTAPELVVLAEDEQSFSGLFYPQEWEKNDHLVLKANPFYAGGRSYLDAVRVTFSDTPTPDLFLSAPGQFKDGFLEFDSGIYQNIYLCFLQGDVGQNTKIALYTLLKRFNESTGSQYSELNSLTSEEESPIAIRIKTFSPGKTASILKYSDIKLYVLASLANLEKDLAAFLKSTNLKIETLFIDDSQLMAFLNSAAVQYVLIDKIFQKKIPAEEKISRILKESSFNRFNARYLRMLSELDEARFSNSQELLTEQIARICEAIVNDGFIFPLFQKNYSLYVRKSWPGLEVDYYGRPLLQKVGKNND
jgi:MarR-like DNA-binding transcriptional regulator SgrR of sgrS sRNA